MNLIVRPRVAILTNYPSDHVTFRGGVETATAALLEGLRAYQDEFDFHVVSLAQAGLADVREQRDGFWFHFLSAQVDRLLESYIHRNIDAFVCISRYVAEIVGERPMIFSIPNFHQPRRCNLGVSVATGVSPPPEIWPDRHW